MTIADPSKFVRNPLGIIGLFVFLIYGIAGVVFAQSVPVLRYKLQLILTLFVVLFPVVILVVFYLLVTKHHGKLYAPGDFKDERLFFRPATDAELRERNIQDVVENEESPGPGLDSQATRTPPAGLRHSEVESAALDYAAQQLGRAISRSYVAQVDDRPFLFDGVHEDAKHLYLFEVKYYRRPAFKKEFLEAALYRASSIFLHELANERERKFCLWFVVVTDFDGRALEEFRSRVISSVDTGNFAVKWLFVSRAQLSHDAQQGVPRDAFALRAQRP